MVRIMPNNLSRDLSLQPQLSAIEGRLTRRFVESFSLLPRILGVFCVLGLPFVPSGCTGETVKSPSSPIPETQPTDSVSISNLVVKDAKIIDSPLPLKCKDLIDRLSEQSKLGLKPPKDMRIDVALSLVYEYNITWKYSQPVENRTLKLPYPQMVSVISNEGAYKATADQDKLSENERHTSGLTSNGDKTESRTVTLVLGPVCKTTTVASVPDGGITTDPPAITKTNMILPSPGNFTLTLSIDGQQISKEFVAQ